MRQAGCSEALKESAGHQQILKVRDHCDLPVGELRLARPIDLEIFGVCMRRID